MHPEERVRIVVETARAVLDERLDPDVGAATLELQRDQVIDGLRSDRNAVTRSECESVASILRSLAERVADEHDADDDTGEPRVEMARVLGELAQALR